MVHNFSLYNLTQEEHESLSYGLNHHIPINYNNNDIKNRIWIRKVKTKIRNTCEKYCHVKVPYNQKKTIPNLSSRKAIVILKQDKGTVIMGPINYTEKWMFLLPSNQFGNLANDPTKSLESNVQRKL